ncbi:transcriptional regulator [Falsiroseomonas bella]|uniref:Transcriptional regulator n=2 Tax=Falsiroseomonas bella TaxID=2184016 RepID=A0A317FH45_9PROT|nr:transcriptional regulator [Falsiroseomonas bella]
MTPAQCRAARGMLAWTQAELATRARVHEATVRGFELGRKEPIRVSLDAIRRALEEAGVSFVIDRLKGEGVFLIGQSQPRAAQGGGAGE